MTTKITELSGKVIVIQSDTLISRTPEDFKLVEAVFEKHGFKVIWVSL